MQRMVDALRPLALCLRQLIDQAGQPGIALQMLVRGGGVCGLQNVGNPILPGFFAPALDGDPERQAGPPEH